jgi:dipeptidyl aminopeptidase/acylaminoacyl peptidase
LFIVLIGCFSLSAQGQVKKLISPEDFGQWEMLRNYSLSEDGKWISYQVDNVNKDKTVCLYNIKSKESIFYENAAYANFSEKGKWYMYENVLSGKETKAKAKNKSEEEKTKVVKKNVLINLENADTLALSGVNRYDFSEEDSFLAMLRENDGINTLVVKDLTTNVQLSFGNVKSYAWQENGELLAMIMETKDSISNAIQLYNPKEGIIKVLDQSKHVYSGLEWGEESDYLFAMKSVEDKNSKDHSYQLMLWKDVNGSAPILNVFDPSQFDNFPENTRILPNHVRLSDDGNRVFFETYSWIIDKKEDEEKEKEEEEKEEYEAPDLEIWNSKDVRIIPQQKKSDFKDSEAPNTCVWHVNTNYFVPLTDTQVESVRVQKNNDILIGRDATPYDFDGMFGRPNYDIYTIDSKTGTKKKVVDKLLRFSPIDPNDNFFVFLKDDALHLFDIKAGKSINITENIDANFIMGDSYDYPVEQKPPFKGGFVEWSEDGSSFLINSEYDVWQAFVDGKPARRITKGKEKEITYRHTFLNREEQFLDFSKELYFSMYGTLSKKSGYAKGKAEDDMVTLVFEDANILRMEKPHEDIDILTFRKESFNQSPNLNITFADLSKITQVSNTNAFQKDFAWGDAELITYTNANNRKAQGILYYPANFESGKKYPMITYIYEKLSDGYHWYNTPSKTNYYNTTVWQQNGYFVLKPDIEFIAGDPGTSSAKTLENAVSAVVEKGDVDPKKVGLVGHSWGGYQAGFVPTQTDIFAASVAGAGLTDFISMYLAITPAFGGSPENNHFEISQERMISPPWKSPENYLRNSSVMNVETLNTPILFEVGDNDMNVNWRQGIEYYNAARRAGKHFVLLVYAKEGHGVREEKNAIDYQQRILKWFGHYLKGEEAEDWIIKGIPYAEQQRRLKEKP